jgi:hypothetical protein
MQKTGAIFAVLFLVLLVISCSKAITVCIVNHSSSDINIDDHGKWVRCASGQMVSFFPERESDHDIAIQSGSETFLYCLTNAPVGFLDIGQKNRLVFDFEQDRKLYILKPTKDPLKENMETQPTGYPLVPK